MSYAVHHHLGLDGAWPAADKCVHACVYYRNSPKEGSGCVSIAIVPIPGERSAHILARWPPPWCCAIIVNSATDGDNVFFVYFFCFRPFFPPRCPPSPHGHCQQISGHSFAADSVFAEHSICCETEGGSEGRWQGTLLDLPICLFPSALCSLWDPELRCQFWSALDLMHITPFSLLLSVFSSFVLLRGLTSAKCLRFFFLILHFILNLWCS